MHNSKNSKFQGQILLIILLILAVISIISLAITINTQKDIVEQTQNKQYEQYYVFSEKMLIAMQKELGVEPLDTNITQRKIGKDANAEINSGINGCTYEGTAYMRCNFQDIPGEIINENTKEELNLVMIAQDSSEITDYYLEQDTDLLITLNSIMPGIITLGWNENNIGWIVTYDYIDITAANPPVYKSAKKALDPDGVFSAGLGSGEPCIVANPNTNPTTINLSSCQSKGTPLFLRIKPVRGNATLSLSIQGNNIPLMRTLTSIATSSASSSSMEQNPSVMLKTNYLLGLRPLGLFNYVLRSEDPDGIIKQ